MARRFGKLTREAAKRLKAGEKIIEGGITAERLGDGDLRWSINVMVARRRVHRVIGRDSEGVTRSDCEAFIERARTEERDGRLQLPPGRKTWLSFEDLARRYLERLEAGGGRNIPTKRRQLNAHLVPAFRAQRADSLTEFTVSAYRKRRLSAQAAPGTINRELATLKHLLRDAVKAKDLKAVPCAITHLPEPPGRMVVLSNAEGDALVRAAIGDQNPDLWLFVAFGLNTAMRHREILRARFDEIDWTRGRLHIGKAKAGAREQPLTPALVAMLRQEREQRKDRKGFIFAAHATTKDPKANRTRMSSPFARAVSRAGLDPKQVTPHVMRHTAITRLVQAGVDLPTIQRISGHKTLAMVLRYAHVSGAHVDRAMAALDQALPDLTAPMVANDADREAAEAFTQELHKAVGDGLGHAPAEPGAKPDSARKQSVEVWPGFEPGYTDLQSAA